MRTNEERSVYTIMIYLNEDFRGGKTKFFTTTDQKTFKDVRIFYFFIDDEAATVFPNTGKALIFNHDVWHEGEQISEGVKYILRFGNSLKALLKDTEPILCLRE